MRNFVITLLLIVGLFGCKKGDTPQEPEITYIQDANTGLCFAHYAGTSNHRGWAALAHVPCEAILQEETAR